MKWLFKRFNSENCMFISGFQVQVGTISVHQHTILSFRIHYISHLTGRNTFEIDGGIAALGWQVLLVGKLRHGSLLKYIKGIR